MYGPGWGYGGLYGAPWGGGQGVTTRHYKVGTLVLDIIDRDKRQSVYQGGVEGIVSKQMLRDPGASLTEAVARVFEGYPFVAGQALPVAPVDRKNDPRALGVRCLPRPLRRRRAPTSESMLIWRLVARSGRAGPLDRRVHGFESRRHRWSLGADA